MSWFGNGKSGWGQVKGQSNDMKDSGWLKEKGQSNSLKDSGWTKEKGKGLFGK